MICVEEYQRDSHYICSEIEKIEWDIAIVDKLLYIITTIILVVVGLMLLLVTKLNHQRSHPGLYIAGHQLRLLMNGLLIVKVCAVERMR